MKDSLSFQAIADFYGDRTAERSGVPLINHIKEGLVVLDAIGATMEAKWAFCLHPLFQADGDLVANVNMAFDFDSYVMTLVMEYRHWANMALSNRVTWHRAGHPQWNGAPPTPGPLPDVRDMLIADKVQNYADFRLYHANSHARARELDHYFLCWFTALGVTGERYAALVKKMKAS